MALKPYQGGLYPLGQFDVLDSKLTAIKGGEVGTVTAAERVNSASEKAAFDALDGYDNISDVKRVALTTVLTDTSRPLWLLDEGTTGYGTLFGQVIGTPAGLSTVGTNLGPHTAAASGKVTAWDKPGIYAVSVDAVGSTLVLTNAACVPAAALSPRAADGVLELNGTLGAITTIVGRFLEFETAPFLVNTPKSLVGATEAAVNMIFSYMVE